MSGIKANLRPTSGSSFGVKTPIRLLGHYVSSGRLRTCGCAISSSAHPRDVGPRNSILRFAQDLIDIFLFFYCRGESGVKSEMSNSDSFFFAIAMRRAASSKYSA